MSNIQDFLRKGAVSTYGTSPLVAGQEGVAGELSALKPHNLLDVLTDFALDWELFRFYNTLPKDSTVQNVVTYKQKTSRSNRTTSGFVGETQRGTVADSTYTSKTKELKYIRQIRQISDVATKVYLSQNLDPTTLQIDDMIKDIITICNKNIIFGDSNVNPLSFDGIIKQQQEFFGNLASWYDSNFVIDLRGASLDVKKVNSGAKTIRIEGFGSATDLFISTEVQTDLENNFYDKGITRTMADGGYVVEGKQISQFQTTTGKVNMQAEQALLANGGIAQTTGADNQDAPLAVNALVVAPAVSANSKFDLPANGDADGFGDYLYGVRAINASGEGAMVMNALAVTIASGQSAEITITDTNLTNQSTGYVVYRSKKGEVTAGAEMFPLFSIGRDVLNNTGYDGAGAGLAYDNNRFLEGNEFAFLVENNKNVWSDMTLKDYDMQMEWYSKNSPAREISVSRGETPLLYNPFRMITFVNVGVTNA